MRISDWSSDVCSSDLACRRRGEIGHLAVKRRRTNGLAVLQRPPTLGGVEDQGDLAVLDLVDDVRPPLLNLVHPLHLQARSEEHTSELQSLMRISYAVFCLKTKNRDE